MTSLVAFVSIDSHGPTAFYLGSDSRITWKTHQRWDSGRKVFASRRYPHAFGYCGDVVFPSLALSQVIELIDTEVLFIGANSPDECHLRVTSAIKASFSLRQNAPDSDFEILHVIRDGSSNQSVFKLWKLTYEVSNGSWTDLKIDVASDRSCLVLALGSGANAITRHQRRWQSSEQGETTRAIYSAFCDSLISQEDTRSGGAPQLAGIYRSGPARMIGTVHNSVKYFCGLPVTEEIMSDALEWRDELFQRIDGSTLKLQVGAKRHSRPKGLS